jgi:hypothetical protein
MLYGVLYKGFESIIYIYRIRYRFISPKIKKKKKINQSIERIIRPTITVIYTLIYAPIVLRTSVVLKVYAMIR